MSQKSSAPPARVPAEKLVRDIRRATRKHHSAEDKIRIVLEGLRGEESIAALCRREAIAESLYYAWSKEFLEVDKRRLAKDAVSDDVTTDPKGRARAMPVARHSGRRRSAMISKVAPRYQRGILSLVSVRIATD
jgi:transposase